MLAGKLGRAWVGVWVVHGVVHGVVMVVFGDDVDDDVGDVWWGWEKCIITKHHHTPHHAPTHARPSLPATIFQIRPHLTHTKQNYMMILLLQG